MKLLFTILSIFISLICFGQTPYNTPYHNLGGLNIAVRDTGGLFVRQTFVAPQYADTTAANLSPTKFYSGSQIKTVTPDGYWYRNAAASQWVQFATSSGSSVNIYNSNGDLTGNRTLNGNELNLFFDSLANYTALSRGNGNPDSAFLIIDNNNSLFAKLGYNVGGARALVTAEPTLATLQFVNHGLVSSVQARDNGKLYLTADDSVYINRNTGQYSPVSDDTSQFTPLAINSTGAIVKLNSWNTIPSWQQTLTKSSLLTTDVNVTTNSNVVFNETFSGSFGNATQTVNSQFGWDFRKTNTGGTENGRILLNNGTAGMTQTSTTGTGTFFTMLSSGISLQANNGAGSYVKLDIPTNVGGGALQVSTQDGLRYVLPRTQPKTNEVLTAANNSGLLYWTGSTNSDTTFTGVTNVIVDTAANTICVYIGAVSTCYPLSGDSVRIVGDTSICIYTDGSPDCFVSSGDTFVVSGGVDSVTIIGNVFCIWSGGSSDCVSINNSNGFVSSAVLSADSSQYDFYSGGTYIFSLPTLLVRLVAGDSTIILRDTTIAGVPSVAIYSTGGGSGGTQDLQQVTDVNYKTTNGLWGSFGAFGDTSQALNISAGNLIIGEAASSGVINNDLGVGNITTGRATGSNSEIYADDIGGIAMGQASSGGKIKSSGSPGAIAIGAASSGGIIQADDGGSMAIGLASGDSLFTTGGGSIVAGTNNVNQAEQSYLFGSGLRNYGFDDADRAFKVGWDANEVVAIKPNDGSSGMPLTVTGDGSITAAFMNGNVGIGDLTPGAKLEIVATDTNVIRTSLLSNTVLVTDSMVVRDAVTGNFKVAVKPSGGTTADTTNGTFTTAQNTQTLRNKSISGLNNTITNLGDTSHSLDTLYWFGTGQSNFVNNDFTLGSFTIELDNYVQSLTLGRTWQIANPATNNICFSDLGATATRNNILWATAKNYRKVYPRKFIKMITHAVGGLGSWYWTPKTTGLGEVTTSNQMLDSLVSRVSSVPSGKKISMLLFSGFEGDIATNNTKYLIGNIEEIYDTLAKLPQFDSTFLMVLTYPANNFTNGVLLTTVLDSIYWRLHNMGNRRIIAVPANFPSFDGQHLDNESHEADSRLTTTAIIEGPGYHGKRGDTAIWKSGLTFKYITDKAVFNGTTAGATGYPVEVQQNGTTGLLALRRTDAGADGRQQGLSFQANNTAAGGLLILHGSETSSTYTDKNAEIWADTSRSLYTNSAVSFVANSFLTIGDRAVRAYRPFTSDSNAYFKQQVRINGVTAVITSASGGTPQIVASTSASGAGATASLSYKSGGVGSGSEGSNMAQTGAYHNGSGGEYYIDIAPAFSGFQRGFTINNASLTSLGTIKSFTAGLNLPTGTTTVAPLRVSVFGGALLTTPVKYTVEVDSSSTGGNAYYTGNNATRYTLAKTLTATATLDFPSVASLGVQSLTITVTGAADGDIPVFSVPNASNTAGLVWSAVTTAANTVTIQCYNSTIGAIDPASGSFRASVLKY